MNRDEKIFYIILISIFLVLMAVIIGGALKLGYEKQALEVQCAHNNKKLIEQKLEQQVIDYRMFQLIVDSTNYSQLLSDTSDKLIMDSAQSALHQQLHNSVNLFVSKVDSLEKTKRK